MMDSFARMARRSCNECGSNMLSWQPVEKLFMLVPLDLRKRVLEGMRFFGNHADSWLCGQCSNFGIFGPTEFAL